MAGVSEMPYRRLARRFGAGAAPTELISAKGLLYGQKRTQLYLRHEADESPFWVQLFAGDPTVMRVAAKIAVDLGAEVLDLNMGCPVRKITRSGAGSALMADLARAHDMVAAMVEAGVPVTVKMRSGWDADSVNAEQVIRAVADAGAVCVTVHARTRVQGYSGQADWSLLRRLVRVSPVPVIGNGDAYTAGAARRMRHETGCAAVMIGRGALGNPWIFSTLAAGAPSPTAEQRWSLIDEHFALHLDFIDNIDRAVRRFRQHLAWYSGGLPGARRFRETVFHLDSVQAVRSAARDYFTGLPSGALPAIGTAAEFETTGALG